MCTIKKCSRVYSKRKNGYKTWDDMGAYLKNKKTGEVYGFKLKHDKASLFQRFIAAIVRSIYNVYMRVGLKMSEQDIKGAAMAGAATV